MSARAVLALRLENAVLWIVVAGAIGLYFLVGAATSWAARRRELAELERTWGQPLRSDRSDRRADGWFRRLAVPDDASQRLDEQTWVDLEMDRVFAWADRTLTGLGAQVLYGWLRQPRLESAGVDDRLRLVDALSPTKTRVALQRILLALGDRSGWDVATVLADPGPKLFGARWMYVVLGYAISPLVLLAVLTGHPLALVAAIAIASINPALHYWASRRTAGHLAGLRAARRAVATAERLWAALPTQTRACFDGIDRDLAVARKAIRVGGRDASGSVLSAMGIAGDAAAEYPRAFFLTEVRAYLVSIRGVERHRDAIQRVLELVGTVDAALAVAHLLEHDRRLCRARRSDGERSVVVAGLVHPLVPEGVPNDVDLGPRSLLVTGSNMAGKSTFLRGVGINVVLAQSLGIACAESFTCASLRVLASMQAHDDLGASVSLYQAEVLRIRTLLEQGAMTPPCLVLLDEVFRGTNPSDRIAASGAVLLELAPRNIVVAATHDLALAGIAAADFDVAHFTERAGEDGVVFDFRLEPGISRSTNALALLERVGYPSAVVRHAVEIARALERPSSALSSSARPGI